MQKNIKIKTIKLKQTKHLLILSEKCTKWLIIIIESINIWLIGHIIAISINTIKIVYWLWIKIKNRRKKKKIIWKLIIIIVIVHSEQRCASFTFVLFSNLQTIDDKTHRKLNTALTKKKKKIDEQQTICVKQWKRKVSFSKELHGRIFDGET